MARRAWRSSGEGSARSFADDKNACILGLIVGRKGPAGIRSVPSCWWGRCIGSTVIG